jgi:hypothetical protein
MWDDNKDNIFWKNDIPSYSGWTDVTTFVDHDLPSIKKPKYSEIKETIEKKKVLFNPPLQYMKYTMHFLKKPIVYETKNDVEIKKCQYSFQIKNMFSNDVAALNEIFLPFNPNLTFAGKSFFINGLKAVFNVVFEEKKNWIVCINILGYKEDQNGKCSPIWQLLSAKLFVPS